MSSGMVVNGSLSKTAVNGAAGAKSQVSGLVVAAMTVVTLLLLTGLFESLPEATLAAVVTAAVVELVDIASLRRLYGVWTERLGTLYGRAARVDFIAAIAAMLGVLVFDTLPGLFIGIAVSLLLLVYRASRPNVAELGRVPETPDQWADLRRHAGNLTLDGIVVLRPEGALFFADAEHVRGVVRRRARAEDVHSIVLDLETVPFVDVTAAEMLMRLRDELEPARVRLLVARDIGQVRDVLRTAGDEHQAVFRSVADAVAAAQDRARA
jgi:MFS superfamily sulfate permease-like transporter